MTGFLQFQAAEAAYLALGDQHEPNRASGKSPWCVVLAHCFPHSTWRCCSRTQASAAASLRSRQPGHRIRHRSRSHTSCHTSWSTLHIPKHATAPSFPEESWLGARSWYTGLHHWHYTGQGPRRGDKPSRAFACGYLPGPRDVSMGMYRFATQKLRDRSHFREQST